MPQCLNGSGLLVYIVLVVSSTMAWHCIVYVLSLRTALYLVVYSISVS